jgi:predicted RNase H-like HicB family nuclease
MDLEKNEDGGYTVTVPALPGCITEGATWDEAVANAQEAIAGYLGCLQELRES